MLPKQLLLVLFCLFGVSVSGWFLGSFFSMREELKEEVQPSLIGDYAHESSVNLEEGVIEPVSHQFRSRAHNYLMKIRPGDHFSVPISVPLYSAEGKLLELILELREHLSEGKELTEQLKIGLELEGFFDDNFPGSERVKETFGIIQADPSAAFSKGDPFMDLLDTIRPLDNSFILKSLSQNLHLFELLTNQTVIFLLGKSGSGRSLAMHYFGNSTFQIQVINGTEKVIPMNIVDEQLWRIKVGVITGREETQKIRAVKIAIPNTDPEEFVYICDFPGFLDTRGFEIDFLNGFSMSQILQKAGHVYPVMVMNHRVKDEQWKEFEDVINVVIDTIPNLTGNNLAGSFSYLFTEGFKNTQEIKDQLMSVPANSKHGDENLFFTFIRDMRKKLNSGSKAYVLDPMDKSKLSLGVLLNGVTSGAPISKSESQFKSFLSANAERDVASQLKVDSHVIRYLVAQKGIALTEEDLGLIAYRLNVIKAVIKFTSLPEYVQEYNRLSQYAIGKEMENMIEDEVNRFARMIAKAQFRIDEDVSDYQTLSKLISLTNHFTLLISKDHIPTFKWNDSVIRTQVRLAFESRMNALFHGYNAVATSTAGDSITLYDLNYVHILAFMQKLSLGAQAFPEIVFDIQRTLFEKLQSLRNQKIQKSTVPRRMIIALDYSGSMMDQGKIVSARENCVAIFNDFINDFDFFGIVLFNNEVQEFIPLQLKEGNEVKIIDKIESLTSPASVTRFRDAILKCYEILESSDTSTSNVNSQDWIIVLTDGNDYGSIATPEDLEKKVASLPDIGIAIIGIGSDVNAAVLDKLAKENATKGYFLQAAMDKASISEAVRNATRNIRQ
jgi:Mg-chelatase subunit ChlD